MPSADPMLGDKRSCDALELVVVPRVRDLGNGFAVRRAMPNDKRQLVGPFIFFDQMGPVQFIAGHGMDVRPHPHIGLATVTYLFDGRVMHRDSEGNALEITPGAMNLMTAGPVGLFIDDGALAVAIIVIVLLSWIFSVLRPDMPLAAGGVLLVGCVGALSVNVLRAARDKR
jgi:hypothetical protein